MAESSFCFIPVYNKININKSQKRVNMRREPELISKSLEPIQEIEQSEESPSKKEGYLTEHHALTKQPASRSKIDYQFEINNVSHDDKRFKSNFIRTSKYTWYNFLPKNMFYQFTRLANVYFILILILQVIKPISISDGQPAILFPLMFVVTLSAIKDIIEDVKRHRQDATENSSQCQVINQEMKEFQKTAWKDIKVGHVVKVCCDEYFPSDMLLLNSSDPKGLCYIETKDLDGETNLKHKRIITELADQCQNETQASSLSGRITCQQPNDRIYNFEGVYEVESGDQPLQASLSAENFLLRGSSLRNTDFVYGVIVYTGHDTKIMRNQSGQRFKFSKLELQLNFQIIMVFIIQIIICALCAVYGTLWERSNQEETDFYLDLSSSVSIRWRNWLLTALMRYGTWILMFTNMVPISMMVTLESCKLIQGFFMQWDYFIYDKDKTMPTKVQSSNLNEELGQVSYIFSDKTGTLTCNVMEFKKFSVGYYSYGKSGEDFTDEMLTRNPNMKIDNISNVNFDDNVFYNHLNDFAHENYHAIKDYLVFLGICHTIIIDRRDGANSFNASSPDELALVNAAKFFGVEFTDRTDDNNLILKMKDGSVEQYKLLNAIEFSSDRKRMSVIVRCPDDTIKVLCKGADSVIQQRLVQDNYNALLSERTEEYLKEFAEEGLRTLLLASKEISNEDYEEWRQEFRSAQCSMENREERVEAVADKIERGLTLIGSTAIEDKLQDKVGETIFAFRQAGMQIWVLTGDKVETAVNVGYSCQLLDNSMKQNLINGTSSSDISTQIFGAQKEQALAKSTQIEQALLVSGEALLLIYESQDLLDKFTEIAEKSKVVLACRVSPKQKADLVYLVKDKYPEKTTLAIGDGANDVNMITAAHVGIGISGLEGQQAARSADYSIGQFKFLRQLLFVHGREAYRRNSYLICYMFYKNIIFVMPQFWYGPLNVFSGQTIYEPWIYQMYNIIFTCYPIIWFAVFDQEHPREHLHDNPELYKHGPENKHFNNKKFWYQIIYGSLQGIVILFLVIYTFEETAITDGGRTSSMWISGVVIYACVVVQVNLQLACETHQHTIHSVLLQSLSIFSYVLVYFLLSELGFADTLAKTFTQIWVTPLFYFLIVTLTLWVILFEKLTYHWSIFIDKLALKRKQAVQKANVARAIKANSEKKQKLILPNLSASSAHHGFAFSQEPGHAPQIFDNLDRFRGRNPNLRRVTNAPLQIPQRDIDESKRMMTAVEKKFVGANSLEMHFENPISPRYSSSNMHLSADNLDEVQGDQTPYTQFAARQSNWLIDFNQ